MTETIMAAGAPREHRPKAVYFHDSDCVEYVQEDGFVIYDRVDEFLTLIHDRTQKFVVGFKLKGFKFILTKSLAPSYRLSDKQFVSLVSAIEAIAEIVGDKLFEDEERARCYQAALKIAANDNVYLHDAGLLAA
ncbi:MULTISPECIES: hypothetical protein [unclassified Mesorhizobium]|uniref:hypothetical protein n=1 Tax=unclassified Mesorhizobium TaxID=325217 RepID=UPI00109317CB|nr:MULTISPECIES: hypothetical protein [unclassified Mesorhizobium]TGQ45468.1 hypothetical protein EN857_01940 [Mesorhizobium sp. M4B.F.Ca.ET.214.01.1.1]TGQ63097.1 hypothetical protein EN854_01940 [Mesorhizobium sp. M4B.F.Ca.ET.211.01.1.1]TGU40735.1 hypothetical protein EN793_01940 [Mesorhizobium sp. M4B.F.Ca.ET.150.01.1.1]